MYNFIDPRRGVNYYNDLSFWLNNADALPIPPPRKRLVNM